MQHELYISTDRRFFLEKGRNVNDPLLKRDSVDDMWKINTVNKEDARKHQYIVPWFLEIVKQSIEENLACGKELRLQMHAGIVYSGHF